MKPPPAKARVHLSAKARCIYASLFTLLLAFTTSPHTLVVQEPPTLPYADRIRIGEAFRLAETVGNRVWPDWDKAPFAILLVTPEHEFLIRHPKPTDDFTLIGDDPLLKHQVWFRKRTYPVNLLATFPAVAGVPTIVIGQAENTASKTSTRWVITLLHEHFHQLQFSQPGYYQGVNALGLARGDETGMWMLNYPFPYSTPEIKEHFSVLSRALGEALSASRTSDFKDKFAAYLNAREKFRSMLEPDDHKYFAFQLWFEGISRYTEYRVAELAATEHQPSREFQALEDYRSFQEAARSIFENIEKELVSVQLDEAKRTVVYNFGAAEALVLDCAHADWRKRYFEERFSLDSHFR